MIEYKPFIFLGKSILREEHSIICNGIKVYHRADDLPAIIIPEILEVYYINGLCHRDNNLPAIIDLQTNYKAWFLYGKKIRVEFESGIVFIQP